MRRFKNLKKSHKEKARYFVAVLAAIVVFVTTYSLMLPAITLEKDKASAEAGIVLAETVGAGDAASDGQVDAKKKDAVSGKDSSRSSSEATSGDEKNGSGQPSNRQSSDNTGSSVEKAGTGDAAKNTESRSSSEKAGTGDAAKQAGTSDAAKKSENGESTKKDETGDSSKKTETGNPSQNAETGDASKKNEPGDAAKNPVTGVSSSDKNQKGTNTSQAAGASADDEADVSMPVVTFTEKTKKIKVDVEAPEGSFPEGTTMKIKVLKEGKDLSKVTSAVEDVIDAKIKTLQAVDISFYNKAGDKIEPKKEIKVTLTSDVIKKADDPVIVHVPDKGDAEIIDQIDEKKLDEKPAEDEVVFEADAFSVYVIVETTIEKNVLASDGKNYKVTVTCGEEAGIPEGAELEVSEVLDATDEYSALVAQVQNELHSDENVGYARFFDIKIIANGEVIQPIASVQVSILLEDSLANTVYAAHFLEDTEVQLINTSHDGDTISFDAESFSIYGVVTSTLENGQTLLYHNSFDGETSDGISGHAIYMDGTGSNWINAGNVIGNNSRVTVSYWAMPTRTGTSWAYYASRSNDSSYNTDRYIGTFTNGNDLHVERYNNGRTGNNTTYYSVNSIDYIEEWNYYTIVYDTTTTYIYVNGELIETKYNQPTINNILGNNSYFQIGKANWGGGEYYQGYIDEFSVVSGAMSASQVAELYNNSKEGVEAYWNNHNKVKVYVYVAAYDLEGNQFKDNPEFLELLGIRGETVDGNGYFPVGEIELDRSFFAGKSNAFIDGSPLITSASDWSAVLAALGELNTSTLVDQNGTAYSENRGNNVGDYMSQAVGDINRSWGSNRTALFHWPTSNWSYGFSDQTVTYHLDLRFQTNKVTFITGNNGITSGASRDGTTVDVRAYILGSEIQQPRNLVIPAGYRLVGYYNDPDFTTPWDKIGTPITQDEVAYIKITPQDNVILHYQPVPAAGGTVSVDAEGVNPVTGTPAGSTATANPGYHFVGWYADEACTQLLSADATYKPTKTSSERWIDGTTYYAKFEEDTVNLTFVAEDHVDRVELVTDAGEVISVTGNNTKEMSVTINKILGPAVTVRGVAEDGYVIKEWTIDGRTGALITDDEIGTTIEDDPAATAGQWTDRTYHVWAETSKTVTVDKKVKLLGSVQNSDINTTVYFVLWDHQENRNVLDENGNILKQSIQIVNGMPQGQISFTDLKSGTYSVWEVDANGNDLSAGTVVIGNDIVVSRIETRHGTDSGNRVTLNNQNQNDGITVINTYNHDSDVISWRVKKEWYTSVNQVQSDRANIDIPDDATATLALYRKDDLSTPLQTVVLDGTTDTNGEITAWEATFDDIQVKDSEGNVIEYIVKEVAFTPERIDAGYFYPYTSETDHDGGVIRNAIISGTINVYKQIEVQPRNAEMDALVANSIGNLKVHVTGPHGYDEIFSFTNVADPYNPSLRIKNIPAGEYTVEELNYEDLLTGRKWNPTLSWIKAGNGSEQSGTTSVTFELATNGASNDSVDVRLKNDYTKYDITATKVWVDNGLEHVDHPAVSLTLYRIDGAGNRSAVGTKIIGANQTGEGLTVKWEQQDQQDQQYTYEIEESLVEGYTCSSITGDMFSGFTVTNTKATMLKLLKIDQSGNPLEGAAFSLTGGDISETGLVSTKRTIKVGTEDVEEALIYENKAMPTGTYTLTETGTPVGYNFLEGDVQIKIENMGADIVVSASINGASISNNQISRDTITGEWTIKIMNDAGVVLPSTGGPGTRIFTLLGSILIALAGMGLVMRRKKRA